MPRFPDIDSLKPKNLLSVMGRYGEGLPAKEIVPPTSNPEFGREYQFTNPPDIAWRRIVENESSVVSRQFLKLSQLAVPPLKSEDLGEIVPELQTSEGVAFLESLKNERRQAFEEGVIRFFATYSQKEDPEEQALWARLIAHPWFLPGKGHGPLQEIYDTHFLAWVESFKKEELEEGLPLTFNDLLVLGDLLSYKNPKIGKVAWQRLEQNFNQHLLVQDDFPISVESLSALAIYTKIVENAVSLRNNPPSAFKQALEEAQSMAIEKITGIDKENVGSSFENLQNFFATLDYVELIVDRMDELEKMHVYAPCHYEVTIGYHVLKMMVGEEIKVDPFWLLKVLSSLKHQGLRDTYYRTIKEPKGERGDRVTQQVIGWLSEAPQKTAALLPFLLFPSPEVQAKTIILSGPADFLVEGLLERIEEGDEKSIQVTKNLFRATLESGRRDFRLLLARFIEPVVLGEKRAGKDSFVGLFKDWLEEQSLREGFCAEVISILRNQVEGALILRRDGLQSKIARPQETLEEFENRLAGIPQARILLISGDWSKRKKSEIEPKLPERPPFPESRLELPSKRLREIPSLPPCFIIDEEQVDHAVSILFEQMIVSGFSKKGQFFAEDLEVGLLQRQLAYLELKPETRRLTIPVPLFLGLWDTDPIVKGSSGAGIIVVNYQEGQPEFVLHPLLVTSSGEKRLAVLQGALSPDGGELEIKRIREEQKKEPEWSILNLLVLHCLNLCLRELEQREKADQEEIVKRVRDWNQSRSLIPNLSLPLLSTRPPNEGDLPVLMLLKTGRAVRLPLRIK